MSIFQNDLRPTKREHANICDVFVIYASTIIARIIPDMVTLTVTLLTLKYTALTGELAIAVWIILIHKNIFKIYSQLAQQPVKWPIVQLLSQTNYTWSFVHTCIHQHNHTKQRSKVLQRYKTAQKYDDVQNHDIHVHVRSRMYMKIYTMFCQKHFSSVLAFTM